MGSRLVPGPDVHTPLVLHIFSRPKGASGTADEDFVLLSLRACLPWRGTDTPPYGGNLLP